MIGGKGLALERLARGGNNGTVTTPQELDERFRAAVGALTGPDRPRPRTHRSGPAPR